MSDQTDEKVQCMWWRSLAAMEDSLTGGGKVEAFAKALPSQIVAHHATLAESEAFAAGAEWARSQVYHPWEAP